MLLRLYTLLPALRLHLHGAKRCQRRVSGYDLVYYRLGPEDGEPWLLLHGLGSTAYSWSPVLGALEHGCRLIIPELSRLGGTRGPRATLDPSGGAAVMSELLHLELGDRPATVAGISLGAWIGVRMGLEYSERLARLLLIDAAGYADQDWERVRRLVTVRTLDDVDRLYAALFYRTPLLFRLSRAGFLRVYSSGPVQALIDSIEERHLYDDAALARIDVPTGLIWAEDDGLFPLAVGKHMARAIPGARLYTLPHCGHALHWEQPSAFRRRLQQFRSEVAPRSAASPASASARA